MCFGTPREFASERLLWHSMARARNSGRFDCFDLRNGTKTHEKRQETGNARAEDMDGLRDERRRFPIVR
jgi:hypothetical protein